jgi:hypothetical protein
MRWILPMLALGICAHAQNVRVIKVSGKKAIVERESGPPLKVGMILNVSGDDSSEADQEASGGSGKMRAPGSRNHTLGGGVSLSTTSTDSGTTKTSSTAIDLDARYGWNKKIMEFGPHFRLGRSSTKTGTTDISTTTFGIGGFFDYNFQPNLPGTEMVWAAGATADYRNSSPSTGSSDTSTIDFFIGPALKWFPLGNSVAVRLDAGLDYARSSTNTTTATSTTFLAHAGLQVYF